MIMIMLLLLVVMVMAVTMAIDDDDETNAADGDVSHPKLNATYTKTLNKPMAHKRYALAIPVKSFTCCHVLVLDALLGPLHDNGG